MVESFISIRPLWSGGHVGNVDILSSFFLAVLKPLLYYFGPKRLSWIVAHLLILVDLLKVNPTYKILPYNVCGLACLPLDLVEGTESRGCILSFSFSF